MATLKGHRGRGVWCCALWGSLLVSGGNDACIRVWNISEWQPVGPSWGAPPAPRVEADGETQLTTGQGTSSAADCQNSIPSSLCPPNTAALREGGAGAPGQGSLGFSGGATPCGSGVGRVVSGGEIIVDIPRAGPQGLKPQGQEKVKCLVLVSRTLLYIATAGGVLWKTGLAASSEDARGQTWLKVWESRSKSPINCLVVRKSSQDAVGSALDTAAVFRGDGGGFNSSCHLRLPVVVLGSQDGSVVLLRDAIWDGTERTEASSTSSTRGPHWAAKGYAPTAEEDCRAARHANEEVPPLGEGAKPGGEDGDVLLGGDIGFRAGSRPIAKLCDGTSWRPRGETFGGASEVAYWEADPGLPVLKLVPLGRPAWQSVLLTVTTGKRLRLWHVEGCAPPL